MIWIILTVLGLLLGWREVEILCQRNSWDFRHFHKWFWDTNKDVWSSFKVSNGLAVLVISWLLADSSHYGTLLSFSDIGVINVILSALLIWVIIF